MPTLDSDGVSMPNKLVSAAAGRISTYRKPSHWKIILRDRRGADSGPSKDYIHLHAAMEWLCRAQDVTGCGGVSAGYYFDRNWFGPYPETTGYIISTFLDYEKLKNNDNCLERAVRMGDWETDTQMDTGAVRGGVGVNDYPIVFNTGQVILGWLALYRMTKESRFLESAIKAADWLVSIQDEDGKWSRHTYLGVPHAYHTRVAWPLLEMFALTDDDKYRIAGERNIDWALSNHIGSGWLMRMAFSDEETPPTHTIAYTLRGLLESSRYLSGEQKNRTLSLVTTAAENIMKRFELRKQNPYAMPEYLPARLNEKWKPDADYSCLTGNCQIAIIWLKLHRMTTDARFLNAALKILDQVKATQSLDSPNPGIRGGIAGSYPIWGGYVPYAYPNWPPKFFADAIMLQENIMQKLETDCE
jgi:hypothetical protein